MFELIGTTTLNDSLLCATKGGIVCMTGVVGNQWSMRDFAPMDTIPTGIYLTSYTGTKEDFMRTPLNALAQQVPTGKFKIQIGKVFHFDLKTGSRSEYEAQPLDNDFSTFHGAENHMGISVWASGVDGAEPIERLQRVNVTCCCANDPIIKSSRRACDLLGLQIEFETPNAYVQTCLLGQTFPFQWRGRTIHS